jgi:hypothetical protein
MNVFALVFAVALAVPSLASAATFGAEVFGAYNSYAMDDANEAIEAANAGGADFSELSGGITGGVALKMWANPNWMFSAAWEPLFVSTTDEATDDELSADGNSFQFTAGYFFPTSSPKAKYGLAAGLGHYSLNAESTVGGVTSETTGSGIGFHFMGLSEWTLSPGFAINGGAGYRVADVEVDDATNDETADYSGFMGRLGLSFYMPSR